MTRELDSGDSVMLLPCIPDKIAPMDHHDINLQQQLDLAIGIAQEAGRLLMEGYEKEKAIDMKSSPIDWVTEYDRAAEKLIVGRLLEANPHHGIMGEEGSRIDGAGGYKWYVDPLDGTTNFAHNFPMFCVSMALYQGDQPLVAVVHDPLREETFQARQGSGAHLVTPAGTKAIRVSRTADLGRSLLGTGFPYDRQTSDLDNVNEFRAFLKIAQGIRRAGSAALDLCYVACGRLDGFWEFKLYAWDMAAARLIVEEAGGKVTQMNGSPITMTERQSLIATNGLIHAGIIEALGTVAAKRQTFGT